MAQIHWANDISGAFNTATDWTGGVVPGKSDDAILDAMGTTPYTVTSTKNQTVNSIQTAVNTTLTIGDEYRKYFVSYDGTGTGQNAGHINIVSGLLQIGGDISNSGSITIAENGGTLAIKTLTLSGGGNVSGGFIVPFDSLYGRKAVLTNIDNTISAFVEVNLVNGKDGTLNNAFAGFNVDNYGTISSSGLGNDPRDKTIHNTNYGTISTSTIYGLLNYGDVSGGSILIALNNFGTINNAMLFGDPTVVGQGLAFNNAGLVEVTGGATVTLSNRTANDVAGGTILADGGVYDIANETIIGGMLQTKGGGVLTLDGTHASVTLLGSITIKSGSVVDLAGTAINFGSLTLAKSGGATTLRIGAVGAYLVGRGALVLGGGSSDQIIGVSATAVLTNVDNTISGGGSLGGGSLTLVNAIDATIDANASTALVIDTAGEALKNAGLIEATGTGGLVIHNTTVKGAGGGVIAAAGGYVELRAADIVGGTLRSTGGFAVQAQTSASTIDGRASNVANQGALDALTGASLTLEGTIANTGAITAAGGAVLLRGGDIVGGTLATSGSGAIVVLGTGNTLDGASGQAVTLSGNVRVANGGALVLQGAIVSGATAYVGGAGTASELLIGAAGATLSGGGRWILGNGASNVIDAATAATLTNADNKITGAGVIGNANLTFVNGAGGIINDNSTVGLIIDTGANTIVNAGQIAAVGPGRMVIKSAVDNTGTLTAALGDLTVEGAVTGAGTVRINAARADFAAGFGEDVSFGVNPSAIGVLELAQSQAYGGEITGFSKTGTTALDLDDIAFGAATTASYSGTTASGVLTVTDGTHTANFKLLGNYLASAFVVSSDGHGGTTVVDPTRLTAAMAAFGASALGAATAAAPTRGPDHPMLVLATHAAIA